MARRRVVVLIIIIIIIVLIIIGKKKISQTKTDSDVAFQEVWVEPTLNIWRHFQYEQISVAATNKVAESHIQMLFSRRLAYKCRHIHPLLSISPFIF